MTWQKSDLAPLDSRYLVYGSLKRSEPIWMQLAALLIQEGIEGDIKRVANYKREREAEWFPNRKQDDDQLTSRHHPNTFYRIERNRIGQTIIECFHYSDTWKFYYSKRREKSKNSLKFRKSICKVVKMHNTDNNNCFNKHFWNVMHLATCFYSKINNLIV